MVFVGDLFSQLEGTGLFEYVLPFLLVFAIVFAIVEKTKIFGDRNGVNVVIAIIMGLLFVTQTSLVSTLNSFLPKISLFIIVAVMVIILFGLFGASTEHGLRGILLLFGAVASLIAIYWGLSPSLGFEVPLWVQSNWDAILVLIIVLIIIFLIVGNSKTQQKGEGFKNLLSTIDEVFGKGK